MHPAAQNTFRKCKETQCAPDPRNTSRALELQSPVVLRVDDLGEQLLSLVTADVQKVSSHSQEQLGLADTAVSRSSRSLLALEGFKDGRGEAGP